VKFAAANEDRCAVENAGSIAGLMLTTETVVGEKPEPEEDKPLRPRMT
jgi:chaperonin GroEL (HSP60 family)